MAEAGLPPRLLGLGHAVPAATRGNDDPVFDWLRANHPAGTDLFAGYGLRHVLADDEDLMTVMVPAARRAVADAGLAAGDIDVLLGCASVGEYLTPSGLSRLHRELGLPDACWVLPLGNDFSNFNGGLWLADALVRAGRARRALVVVGGDWTRYVDYHTPQAVSAADGAGAAVVGVAGDGDRARWTVLDQATATHGDLYGTMTMRPDRVDAAPPPDRPGLPRSGPAAGVWTQPCFHISAAGGAAFSAFGARVPPQAVLGLLARHGLAGGDIALISHQASSVLMDAWAAVIRPAQYLRPIERFGNMTVASIAATLAWGAADIVPDRLVLLALGPDMHANALLLARGGD